MKIVVIMKCNSDNGNFNQLKFNGNRLNCSLF